MSWLKKTAHKISKSVRRMAHGKFHLGKNWIRNSGFGALYPSGLGYWNKKWRLSRNLEKLRWGRIKKSKKFQRIFGGNNNSQSIAIYDSGSGYLPSGYEYRGRTLSQMTGGS